MLLEFERSVYFCVLVSQAVAVLLAVTSAAPIINVQHSDATACEVLDFHIERSARRRRRAAMATYEQCRKRVFG